MEGCARRRRGFSPSKQQQQRGNIGTCPLLNRKGSCQCRRIKVLSKETLMAPWSAAWPWEWWQRRCEEALPPGRSLDWRERLSGGTATPSGPRGQAAGICKLPASWPRKAHDPRHALQLSGGLADDGDIVCHPILVLPFLQDFDVANAGVRAERNPLKTQVIYCVNDLHAAPPEWRLGDVRSLAKTSSVTDGSITLGVAVGSRQFVADQLLSKAEVIRALHERAQLCQDPQTEFSLLRESLGVSCINHILRVHGHTILAEQNAAAVYEEIGQRSLERLFPGVTEDSMTQATLSASQSGIGFQRARDIAAPAHLRALIAAKPRIHGVIRDAVLAGLLLETRLSEVIDTATSTYLSALDNDEQATARLFIQKAAQAADESWQQTVSGQQGREVAGPTIASLGPHSSAFHGGDSDDMDFSAPRKGRLSGPQLQVQLSRLTDRTRLRLLSKGAWQQVTGIEDLCHAQVSRRWLFHLDACAGSVLAPHDYITNVQKRLGNRLWEGDGHCRCCGFFLDPQVEHAETCSTAEATRGRYTWCSRHGLRHETCGPRHYHGTQGTHRFRNPGRLICSPPLLSPDAARPWTCAWPPPLQRQPAEVLHGRHLIVSRRTTEMNSEISDSRTSTTAHQFGQRMGGRTLPTLERFSTRQTSPPVGTGSTCQRSLFIAD